jgi:hypothetical protein
MNLSGYNSSYKYVIIKSPVEQQYWFDIWKKHAGEIHEHVSSGGDC